MKSLKGHPLYFAWQDMRKRCNDPKKKSYKWYGAKGIKVCPEWSSFSVFLAYVGERPPGMTLDRIDPTKGYEPGNVRWATHMEQTHNRTTSKACRRGHVYDEANTVWTTGGRYKTKRCKACVNIRAAQARGAKP